MNYKYIGIGSIISILLLYLYFRFGNKNTIIETRTDEDTILLFEKLQKNDKVLKLLLSHTIKYLKRDKYGDKQLLDRLNKDSLFNKDYEPVRILIDTHNIINKDSNNFDPGNYVFDLDSGTDNITGGLGRYKNVIGFRLIHAIMPNAAYVVSDSCNKLKYKAISNILDTEPITITITLTNGYYTLGTLENAFINASYTNSDGNPLDDVTSDSNFYKITTSSVLYSPITHLFTFNTTGSLAVSTHYHFCFKLLSLNNSAARLFGLESIDQDDINLHHTQQSNFVPDMSIHYTDLVVDEIPYIACKNNPRGHHIIDRIPLNVDNGTNISYEPYRDPYQNYFLPISLNKLTIKLLEPIHGNIYNPQDKDHSLEFELTMIKNEKNIGLFN
jgi:hypothetical protein